MRVAVYSTRTYDQQFLSAANEGYGHDLVFLEARLVAATALLAEGFDAVCAFVNDRLDAEVLRILSDGGVRMVALRSAGFNHVDLAAADSLSLTVARVPAYSPHAVAEHAVALILSLNRKIYKAYQRVREGNFALDGLVGFDLNGKVVGVVGTGKIGRIFARIMSGFGCRVVGYDLYPSEEARQYVEYISLEDLLACSDIVALHLPLTPDTFHLIDAKAVSKMKKGVMLINTSRGALIDTRAVIDALKHGRIGHLGLDVYEEEEALFFRDLSDRVIQDDVFMRLLTFPNVVITGHQAFFTREALSNIAETTIANLTAFERGEGRIHTVNAEKVA
jgi:D-lactate dehydrogenase